MRNRMEPEEPLMAGYSYTAYVEYDAETGLYVGTIPAVSGAHSQGAGEAIEARG